MKEWKFEWITEWDVIYSESFQEKWMDLYNDAINSHIFFHPSLSMAWIKTYRPIRNLSPLFCIASNDETCIFFPLVLWKKNWKNAFQNIVIPVGHSDFDYHTPYLSSSVNKNKLTSFYSDLLGEIKMMINIDSFLIDGIHHEINSDQFNEVHNEPCSFIELEEFKSIEDFRSSLPTKIRKDIDRRKRRMSEQGKIEFKVFQKEELQLALNELPQMLKFHNERWPNAYKAANFHSDMLKYGLEQGTIHFSKIIINNSDVSWRICFFDSKKFYSYMPTINPAYNKFSPGKVHLLFCIEEAIKKNISVYDLLRGAELYKSEWTNQFETIRNIEWHNIKLSSKMKRIFIDLKNSI